MYDRPHNVPRTHTRTQGETSPAAASPIPAASVGLDQPAAAGATVAPPVVDPVTRQPMAFSDNTHSELNEKIRSLEAELSVAKSKVGSAEQRATEMQRKASALQEQLDEEKAQRDDTVREMRADFDTKFIQKQAEYGFVFVAFSQPFTPNFLPHPAAFHVSGV